jgi:hypothetical protein
MWFIKNFDQVIKHNFDQTPILLENFDQVIRSSEIWSSDPLSLSDTWYWRKTQFSIFQLEFSKQVGKKKQVGTFLFSCMMLTFGRLKWFRFYSSRLKTNLHLKLISIKTKLRSLIQSPADQTSFDWKWSKSSVWWVRTVQLLSAQTFLQFTKAICCSVWQCITQLLLSITY